MCEMSILARALALAEHVAVYLPQRNIDDQQAGADACPLRHFFSRCKEQGTGRTSLLQSSTPDHPATSLLVAGRAEQAFGDTLKTIIAMSSRGGKVIYHQQRVLGVECQ